MTVLCLYHAACTDGFAAAWSVRHALGAAEVEAVACSYGNPPPDVRGRDVVLVDFSYKRPALEEMAAVANSVLVLDHHKTAQEDLRGLPDAPANWAQWEYAVRIIGAPRLAALFDMERSGAGIAWDFFFPDGPRPRLIDLVEIRDLWRKDHRLWGAARQVHAYINSFPFTFQGWDDHIKLGQSDAVHDYICAQGDAILRQADRQVGEIIGIGRREAVIEDTPAVLVNCPPWMASDVGDRLGSDPGVLCVATYQDTKDWRLFSLRSRDPDGVDVSEIAKAFGGGGHKHSAGFRVRRDHPLAAI